MVDFNSSEDDEHHSPSHDDIQKMMTGLHHISALFKLAGCPKDKFLHLVSTMYDHCDKCDGVIVQAAPPGTPLSIHPSPSQN